MPVPHFLSESLTLPVKLRLWLPLPSSCKQLPSRRSSERELTLNTRRVALLYCSEPCRRTDALRKHFSSLGRVTSLSLHKDSSGAPTGNVIVRFVAAHDAETVRPSPLALHSHFRSPCLPARCRPGDERTGCTWWR